MISPETLNLETLPSVLISNRAQLPPNPSNKEYSNADVPNPFWVGVSGDYCVMINEG
jgi:hypothetical protein